MDGFTLPPEILPFFFLVALLYSSVGHGGASGYLALFALFGVASPAVAPLALLLNVLVASASCFNYFRGGHFDRTLLLPFIVSSMPAAFLGAFLPVPQALFSLLLGIALFLAAGRILLADSNRDVVPPDRARLWGWGIPMGGTLGLVSGMIGIGGGVFLSPLLLLLRWADLRRTAAVSSAFIVLNSLAGLTGHIARANLELNNAVPLALVVGAGGYFGSRMGAFRVPLRALQGVLFVVLIMAGAKLLGRAMMP